MMTELKGFEEKKGASRAKGVQHGALPNRQTWLERKTQEAAELGVTSNLTVSSSVVAKAALSWEQD